MKHNERHNPILEIEKKYFTVFIDELNEWLIDEIKRDMLENPKTYMGYEELFVSRNKLKKVLYLGKAELEKLEGKK